MNNEISLLMVFKVAWLAGFAWIFGQSIANLLTLICKCVFQAMKDLHNEK